LGHNRGMSLSLEIAALYRRDLPRLVQQLDAFDDAQLWAGNLLLHLNGNLREFVGRQIGGVAYARDRPREFAAKDVPRAELTAELMGLAALIPSVLDALPAERWDEMFPEQVLPGGPVTNRQFVIHLYGHLNYHLGQIDYLRRTLTGQGALARRPT
jgi:phage FluMu protein gp41